MGGFFSSEGGSILGAVLGKVANVANPYAGAVVGGVFEGLKASEQAKEAKKLAKEQIRASLGITPQKKAPAPKPMKVPKNAKGKPLTPPATSSVAMEKRTNPSGSTIATGLVSQVLPKMLDLGPIVEAPPVDEIVRKVKDETRYLPFTPSTASKIRTQGSAGGPLPAPPSTLVRSTPMSNGYSTALARRFATGGYTRSELAMLGVTDLPRTNFGRLYFGPQGEFLQYPKRRRMNACNPKALSRAFRRVEAFGRVAKRYWNFTKHSGAKIHKARRKR